MTLSVARGDYHMFADVQHPQTWHIPELTVAFHIPKVHRQHSLCFAWVPRVAFSRDHGEIVTTIPL